MELLPTHRLYHQDSTLKAFTARVLAHGQFGKSNSVILDQSAFYPEAGGQMGDRGHLGDCPVIDVQVDDQGVIHHLVEAKAPEVGQSIEGRIDFARRRIHMAQHTGQHMLSQAALSLLEAPTISSRLGETGCTLDLGVPAISPEDQLRIEAQVNQWIEDDLPIQALFPTADELQALPLRRTPKVSENIRVIHISGIDHTPCGGTHCQSTAQVGVLHILKVERYKGMSRVHFAVGRRAHRLLFRQARQLREIGRDLSCGADDVHGMYASLKRDLADVRMALGRTERLLAEGMILRLSESAGTLSDRPLISDLGPVSATILRNVSAQVAENSGKTVLFAAQTPGGLHVMAQSGDGGAWDCGKLVKALGQALGGRGGGRAHRAEGKFPALDWETSVNDAWPMIIEQLKG